MSETVPAGRFVPVEPTKEMVEAGVKQSTAYPVVPPGYENKATPIHRFAMRVCLKAAIAAAPALPTAEADELRAALQKIGDLHRTMPFLESHDADAVHGRLLRAREIADAALAITPETAKPGTLPADVVELVKAARIFAFEDRPDEVMDRLDRATEAFADRVPWDDEPEVSEIESLHEPSIVEGGIKLPSNLPETAKPDTSAAAALPDDPINPAAVLAFIEQWTPLVFPESEVGKEHFGRSLLELAAGGLRAALHPAPATASSGGMVTYARYAELVNLRSITKHQAQRIASLETDLAEQSRRADEAAEEHAVLVEAMLSRRPFATFAPSRAALILAARAIRRGRHLTDEERAANLQAYLAGEQPPHDGLSAPKMEPAQ